MRGFRRSVTVLLLVAVSLWAGAYAVQAGEMADMTVTAGIAQSISHDGKTCVSDMTKPAACAPVCSGAAAILPQMLVGLSIAATQAFDRAPDQSVVLESVAPDPYPPKSLILG